METFCPRPRGKPEFMYLVRKHACKVERVRVAEIAPRYIRVYLPNGHTRRESRKSPYHVYLYHFAQAKRTLEVDYELKIAKLRNQLKIWEDELRLINMTREEDL